MNPSILTLGIAACAFFLSFNTQEEIVKVAAAFVALFTGFLALCYAPWIAKLVIIAIPLLLDRVNHWSADT